jgi:hypothetical protein
MQTFIKIFAKMYTALLFLAKMGTFGNAMSKKTLTYQSTATTFQTVATTVGTTATTTTPLG